MKSKEPAKGNQEQSDLVRFIELLIKLDEQYKQHQKTKN